MFGKCHVRQTQKRNKSVIGSHVANTSTHVFASFHRYSSQPVLLRTHPRIVHRRYQSGIIKSFLMCFSFLYPPYMLTILSSLRMQYNPCRKVMMVMMMVMMVVMMVVVMIDE